MSRPLALRPPPATGEQLVVRYPDVVLEWNGNWIRARPTRVGEDMFIASKIRLQSGDIVETAIKMPIRVYEKAHAMALNRLGPRLYKHYLGALPPPPSSPSSSGG